MYVPVLFFKIKLSSYVLYGTYLTGTSNTQNIYRNNVAFLYYLFLSYRDEWPYKIVHAYEHLTCVNIFCVLLRQ